MLFCSVQFYPILFCPMLSRPRGCYSVFFVVIFWSILFCPLLYYPILSTQSYSFIHFAIRFYPILSHWILSYPNDFIQAYSVIAYPILSYAIASNPILFCPFTILFYPILSCRILSYILFCTIPFHPVLYPTSYSISFYPCYFIILYQMLLYFFCSLVAWIAYLLLTCPSLSNPVL